MKYRCEILIRLPREKVVALWEDQSYFNYWQDGFESMDLLEGELNTVGSKSRIVLNGKTRIELIETVLLNDLPNSKKALYEHRHMTNTQNSLFEVVDAKTTRYISEVEYIKFNGVMIKLMAFLFPMKFKAQSLKWMKQFKEFVESGEY